VFIAAILAWSVWYPATITYLLALAASLQRAGRWAALAQSAYLCGATLAPLVGSSFGEFLGYHPTGLLLGQQRAARGSTGVPRPPGRPATAGGGDRGDADDAGPRVVRAGGGRLNRPLTRGRKCSENWILDGTRRRKRMGTLVVGVPSEPKDNENRVALTPDGVVELVHCQRRANGAARRCRSIR
jgi:hypothetical protein